MKLLENKNKLKCIDLYENYSEENYNNNLSSDQVGVSEQVKDRENFSNKNLSYSLTRVFVLTIECFMVELKNWLERIW